MSYALSFAALTAVLSHVWIWHRQEIFDGESSRQIALDLVAAADTVDIAMAKRTRHSDIHNRLMEAYDPVPNSWYYGTLIVTFLAAGEPDPRSCLPLMSSCSIGTQSCWSRLARCKPQRGCWHWRSSLLESSWLRSGSLRLSVIRRSD